MVSKFANRAELVKPSAIRELLRLGADKSITSFGGGYPDADLFPMEQLNKIYAQVVCETGRDFLQYTDSQGNYKLRERIVERALKENIETDPSRVLILNGAQQGLDLMAKLFVDPGDRVITENPTFLGALIAFNPYQPAYSPVEIDNEGLDTSQLRQVLSETPNVAFIYTIPDFQNPTGATMSLRRRKELLDLAKEFDVYILEDSPYRDLRFEGESIPTLKSLDDSGHVVHLGSFSKTLAPGLRTGWMIAEPHVMEKLALLKLASDTQSSTINMEIVSRFLDEFDFESHIQTAQQTYKKKRDLMLRAMDEHFPSTVKYSRPEGGLFTWVEFEEKFDSSEFMKTHSIPSARVAYVPGGSFFPNSNRPNFARFSYSGIPDEVFDEAIGRLGALLKSEK